MRDACRVAGSRGSWWPWPPWRPGGPALAAWWPCPGSLVALPWPPGGPGRRVANARRPRRGVGRRDLLSRVHASGRRQPGLLALSGHQLEVAVDASRVRPALASTHEGMGYRSCCVNSNRQGRVMTASSFVEPTAEIFVGRQTELARLSEVMSDVKQGRPCASHGRGRVWYRQDRFGTTLGRVRPGRAPAVGACRPSRV